MRGRITIIEALILIAILGVMAAIIVPRVAPKPAAPAQTEAVPAADDKAEALAALETELKPAADTVWQDGLAAIVLVDVSGSMRDRVRDADGERRRKIEIAHRTALDLVRAFETYAREHADQRVLVGIYEFSARRGQPAARAVVPLAAPDSDTAAPRIEDMKADGGTPIGDAMVVARLALDASALRRRHLIVLTDGENTDGRAPADVVRVLERQADEARAGLYFVAFDIAASAFAPIKESGGVLLSARDGAELATTFRELLSDRILVEAPRAPIEK
jgi:Mg-chelatase subunit ChlD